jgi:RimJ/RimL family protein N-acetyltransferase
MTAPPILRTERLELRPFTVQDAPDVQRLAGAAAVADTTLTIPHPYEDGAAESWIAGHAPEWERRENAVFAITTPADGLVGAINLRMEARHQRGEIGYWIGQPFWNRGFATEALIAVMAFGFDEAGLNRIMARHLPRNAASGRVMQKAGMHYEGEQREHIFKNGRFETLHCYAMLRSDVRPDASSG